MCNKEVPSKWPSRMISFNNTSILTKQLLQLHQIATRCNNKRFKNQQLLTLVVMQIPLLRLRNLLVFLVSQHWKVMLSNLWALEMLAPITSFYKDKPIRSKNKRQRRKSKRRKKYQSIRRPKSRMIKRILKRQRCLNNRSHSLRWSSKTKSRKLNPKK